MKLTLKGTDELFTLIDHERDADGNIVVEGETWTDVVEKVARLNFFNRSENRGSAREELENMIERYNSLNNVSLILDMNKDTEGLAQEFFTALSFREVVKVGG